MQTESHFSTSVHDIYHTKLECTYIKGIEQIEFSELTGIRQKTRETTSVLADFVGATSSNTSKTTCFCPGGFAAAALCRRSRVHSDAQDEQGHDHHQSGNPLSLHFPLPAAETCLVT